MIVGEGDRGGKTVQGGAESSCGIIHRGVTLWAVLDEFFKMLCKQSGSEAALFA